MQLCNKNRNVQEKTLKPLEISSVRQNEGYSISPVTTLPQQI